MPLFPASLDPNGVDIPHAYTVVLDVLGAWLVDGRVEAAHCL